MGVLNKVLNAIRQKAESSSSIIGAFTKAHPVGDRMTPARSSRNDSQIGGRLDWGTTFTNDGQQYQNVNFQLNKNAQDSSIKQLVQKNGSHKKYAEVPVLVSSPVVPTEKVERGKKVKLSSAEIEAAKQTELKRRRDQLFKDMERAL